MGLWAKMEPMFASLIASVAIGTMSTVAEPKIMNSVQAWSFNRYTVYEAIDKTAEVGAAYIEMYPGQRLSKDNPVGVGPDMGDEATRDLKLYLAEKKVSAVAFGVTGIPRDYAGAKKLFSWAQKLNIQVINTESVDAMDTIETMVKEFNIRVGFHNHPKTNDPNYKVWDPAYVYSIVKDRDDRIGACADTGHWIRSGIKPLDAIKSLKGRIVSSHLKDLNEFSADAYDLPYGQGVSEIGKILDAYRKLKYSIPVSVEYERNWDTSVPEIAQCIGFVRGYTANWK